MDEGGTTWVVVADESQARFLEERRRAGELRELEGRRMRVLDADRPHGHRHMATVQDSGRPGRHGAGERAVEVETARRFLRRVADRLEDDLNARAFDSLTVIAPPRALGLLKAALCARLAARLAAATPRDCVREEPEDIRERLRQARHGSARP